MQWRTLAGTVVVTAVSLAVLGIAGNFALGNELFVSSEMQTPALLSFGFILTAIVVFGAIGRPWQSWDRTSYW
ncbi:hypothetical protein SAMN05216226_101214 [Halovenus aranensis]|jgi:hypothetical protein|uniref:Uncharacterized protein n=1 Tax=Halovenus aranensis TaxID=890420 RepID=A0A1G8S026_9EURY|nr:hypothetical protein [Halovenus aranensis]SDJ22522.1 hypothetical protein SAMN05216226_101214 [Halovenus aranensis]